MLLDVASDTVFALHRPKVGLHTLPSTLRASWERTFVLVATPKRTDKAIEILDDFPIYFYNKVVLLVLGELDKAHDEEPGKTH